MNDKIINNRKLNVFKTYLRKEPTILLLFGIFLLCASSCEHKINSTEDLMKEISERYYGKWFTQVKFSQNVYIYENDSLVNSEINDEEYCFPSNLIIYEAPGDSANRNVYKNDSVFCYKNNELTSAEKITHGAVVFSMDIFSMTFPEIMKRWADFTPITYNINKFHERIYDGRKVYVIGADKGDTLSNQVWFDAEHLYFIKQIKNTKSKGLVEVSFLNYTQLEKGWIEQEVEFKSNGKVYMREKYFNIQFVK
jgi:hypothetical protein